jgi:tRNA U34 5-methylaminomethyl-2-thiouridine-forming methyltransferase MnmC
VHFDSVFNASSCPIISPENPSTSLPSASSPLCWGVCIRRGRILLKKGVSGAMQLPQAAGNEAQALLADFEELLGVEVSSLGPIEKQLKIEGAQGYHWCFLTLKVAPEVTYDERIDTRGLCWVPLSQCNGSTHVLDEPSQMFLQSFLADPGNAYTLVQTTSGKPTFAHLATGEILHSQEGPFEEAQKLYVEPLGISKRTGTYTLYDCGLGCGTLVIAFVEAFLKNTGLTKLQVLSFDLEKKGLKALLDNLVHFPEALPHVSLIEKMISEDSFSCFYECEKSGIQKELTFKFIKGDFKETIFSFNPMATEKADGICFDFFSPFNQTSLWSYEVLERLRSCCSANALLSTYSSATAVRASFLAAGFFVGEGTPSGKKNGTTLASVDKNDLLFPLGQKFLQTFLRSQKPFFENQSEERKKVVKDRVCAHAQFLTE